MLSNYPPGVSDSTVGAPWNDPDVPEKEFDVTCSQSLSKTVSVLTSNYIPGAEGVDYESDDEGGCYAVPYHDDPDTSDTNWEEEYHANDHYTPLQLIELFKRYLENMLDKKVLVPKSPSLLRHLIKECTDWMEDETEIIEA